MAKKPVDFIRYDPNTGKFWILGRLSYFKFIMTKSAEAGKLQYRTNVLLDPNTQTGKKSIEIIEKAIKDCIAKGWPGKNPTFDPKRYPLRDGNSYTTEDGDIRSGYENMKFIPLSNTKKPKYKDRAGEETTQDDDVLYSGCYALVAGHVYDVKGKEKGGNGIFATLGGVQYFKAGERFGAEGMADDEFENLGDEDDDEFSDSSSGGDEDEF